MGLSETCIYFLVHPEFLIVAYIVDSFLCKMSDSIALFKSGRIRNDILIGLKVKLIYVKSHDRPEHLFDGFCSFLLACGICLIGIYDEAFEQSHTLLKLVFFT